MRFAQPAVLVTDGLEAAAIWLPPGEPSSRRRMRRGHRRSCELGRRSRRQRLELLERFEAAQPPDPPHYYLSLLGVHDDHRGRGIGMALLAENLARFDAEGVATYLESSNAANDHRYETLGYRRIGEFTTPGDAVTIASFWRDAA